MTTSNGGQALTVFKYQRLPDFCFVCGRLDHQESECDEVVKAMKLLGGVSREYGPWLRADGQYQKVGGLSIQTRIDLMEGEGKQYGEGKTKIRKKKEWWSPIYGDRRN